MVFGKARHIFECLLGRIESASIHPHPTVCADPLGAAADVVVAACDDHGDIVRVFQIGAVFRASIPDGVFGREFALGLDFTRSHVVEIQSPMGNISMVADPIQQLAAAGVVVPAPVHVHAGFDIRHHFRRPNPSLVIELLGRGSDAGFLGCPGEIGMARGQANFDTGDFPDQPVADNFAGFEEVLLRSLPGTGLPDALVLLNGSDDGLLLGDGSRQRFFAVNILFVVGGLGRHQGMPMIGHGQHDSVDVLASHHFAVVMVGFAVLVFILVVDSVHCGLQVLFVEIAGGDHLAILLCQKGVGIARTHHSPAYHAHRDALGRGSVSLKPQHAAWNYGWRHDGHAGGG